MEVRTLVIHETSLPKPSYRCLVQNLARPPRISSTRPCPGCLSPAFVEACHETCTIQHGSHIHTSQAFEPTYTPSCVVVQVKCVAVVPPHEARSLDMFMKDVFKVAPLLNSADKDETHSVLAVSNPNGPMVSQDAKMLQLLAKPVTVSKFLFLLLDDSHRV